jgi:hypothetical protein
MQSLNNPVARSLATSQAKQYAGAGASGLQAYIAEENVWSLKILSFLAGLTMFILSILSIIQVFGVVTQPFDYIISIYFALFSFLLLAENARDSWPGVERARAFTTENFGIMKTNIGRGSMKIFLGTLWISTSNTGAVAIFGYVLIALGCLYIISNYLCSWFSAGPSAAEQATLDASVPTTTTKSSAFNQNFQGSGASLSFASPPVVASAAKTSGMKAAVRPPNRQ